MPVRHSLLIDALRTCMWMAWPTLSVTLLLAQPLSAQAAPSAGDSAAVVRVAETLLRAISTKDTALARTVMLPGAQFVSVRDPAAATAMPRIQRDSAFYVTLPRGTDVLRERMWSPNVRFFGSALAEVVAPYDFHINGTFSHCGIDVFTLVRANGQWMLGALAYTTQRDGCAASPLGPPKP